MILLFLKVKKLQTLGTWKETYYNSIYDLLLREKACSKSCLIYKIKNDSSYFYGMLQEI